VLACDEGIMACDSRSLQAILVCRQKTRNQGGIKNALTRIEEKCTELWAQAAVLFSRRPDWPRMVLCHKSSHGESHEGGGAESARSQVSTGSVGLSGWLLLGTEACEAKEDLPVVTVCNGMLAVGNKRELGSE
jgi:hypothetical protein